jgi:acetyl esterase/lipase
VVLVVPGVWSPTPPSTAPGTTPTTAPTTAPDRSFEVLSDRVVRASDGADLTIDAYVPRTAGRHPAVVLVHGGSWTGGDKTDFAAIGATFTQNDWVAVSVNYRLGVELIDRQADDVLDAVDWIRDNAAGLSVDPRRIALLGASAGGHLAALAATRAVASGASGVDALVTWSGVFDLAALAPRQGVPAEGCNASCVQTFGSGVLEGVVGCAYDECPERYENKSPLNDLDDVPPMLLASSTDDSVPPDQAREMARAVRDAGVAAETVTVDGAAHGYDLGPQVTEQTTGFLEQYLARSDPEPDESSRAGVAVLAAALVIALALLGAWVLRRARGRRRASGVR